MPGPKNLDYAAALGKLCSTTGKIPSSACIPEGHLKKLGDKSFASGGCTDEWRGVLNDKMVAIKVYRMSENGTLFKKKIEKVSKCLIMKLTHEQKFQLLCENVPMWSRLSHENILPFRGVYSGELFDFSLVYDWGEKGNIIQYLSSDPTQVRPPLVCKLQLLWHLGIYIHCLFYCMKWTDVGNSNGT